MVDTNRRPDNEQWLFDTLVEMEGLGVLGDFCRHIGVDPPGGAAPLVETAWPAVRDLYAAPDGSLEITRACHDLLAFPPVSKLAASLGRMPGGGAK